MRTTFYFALIALSPLTKKYFASRVRISRAIVILGILFAHFDPHTRYGESEKTHAEVYRALVLSPEVLTANPSSTSADSCFSAKSCEMASAAATVATL
jgi:hypothetical protein